MTFLFSFPDLNFIFINFKLSKQQQQMTKKAFYGSRASEFQLQNGSRDCGDGRAHGFSVTAWPGLKKPGSGTRDFFPGVPVPKKERTGTGVFLPKRFSSIPVDTRKKSGYLAADLGSWLSFC